MGVPSIVGAGAVNAGTTGAVTYAIPAHVADDILLFVGETNLTVGLTAPSGWTHMTSSPRAQGSNVVSANVMWRRATASGTTITVPASSNHQVGFVIVIRGCVTTGDPFGFTPVGSGTAASTSFTVAGGTTVNDDVRVFIISTSSADQATNHYNNDATNGSLASFAMIAQGATANGNGGGLAVWSGTLASPGPTGTTTGTQTVSSANSNLVFSLVGEPAAATNTGTSAVSLPSLASAAVAAVLVAGSVASTLPPLSTSSAGSVTSAATSTVALPSLTSAATGTATTDGTVVSTLPSLTTSASGVSATSGSSAATLPSLASSAAGTSVATGTSATTLPSLTSAATGTSTTTGSSAITLPSLTSSVTGSGAAPSTTGAAAVTLPSLSAAATGDVLVAGVGAATLPQLSAAALGALVDTGSSAATLPALAAQATGYVGDTTPRILTAVPAPPALSATPAPAPAAQANTSDITATPTPPALRSR